MTSEEIETLAATAHREAPPIPDIREDESFANVVQTLSAYV